MGKGVVGEAHMIAGEKTLDGLFFTAKKGLERLIDFERIDIGPIQSRLGQYFAARA